MRPRLVALASLLAAGLKYPLVFSRGIDQALPFAVGFSQF